MTLFHRERAPLATLLATGTTGPGGPQMTSAPIDPAAVLQLARDLHVPMAGHLRAQPGRPTWCQGCGGVTAWPCPTIRVLDGHPPAVDAVGVPMRLDEQEATG